MSFAEDMGHDMPADWYDDSRTTFTTIDCNIKASTDKAMLIEVVEKATGKKLISWVPKSKCQYNPNTKTIDIPDWLYSKLTFKEE